jgi:hypothetical protein
VFGLREAIAVLSQQLLEEQLVQEAQLAQADERRRQV